MVYLGGPGSGASFEGAAYGVVVPKEKERKKKRKKKKKEKKGKKIKKEENYEYRQITTYKVLFFFQFFNSPVALRKKI